MLMVGRTVLVPAGIAAFVLAACAVYAWSEYRVARSGVPDAGSLVLVDGTLATCEFETVDMVEPYPKLNGGWSSGPAYVLTVAGTPGRFRTPIVECGAYQDEPVAAANRRPRVSFSVSRAALDSQVPSDVYGYAVDGRVYRTTAEDLARHRRTHDFWAPLNAAALILLAVVAPVSVFRSLRRRNPARAADSRPAG